MDNALSSEERELVRAASLVSEVGGWREQGVIDTQRGSDDDDLLGAVEALEDALRDWRRREKARRA